MKAKGGSGAPPTGSNSKGKECITKYYKQLGLKAPGGGVSRRTDKESTLQSRRSRLDSAVRKLSLDSSRIEKRAECKANIMLFARGTLEIGTMGNTVGPALSSALSRQGAGKWRSDGISYTADIAGDDCIGFPGGIKCVDQLAKVAAQCPESKFFLSGYSQGAMVARICAAYSKDNVKSRIKVSLANSVIP
jgi:hypothetical protein